MRRKLLGGAAGLTTIALGALAAAGLAGGGGDTPAAPGLVHGYESADATVHRVAAPSAGAETVALRARGGGGKKVRIAYFETDPFPVADATAVGDSLGCPGNRRVLGGYFGSDGVDVALTFSAPENNRRWFVGVTNLAGIEPGATQVFTGIVCAKGAR